MELPQDCKNHIVLYLYKDISTLVSREIRKMYFRENGVKIKDLEKIVQNQNSEVLTENSIKLLIKKKDRKLTEITNQKILNNITKIKINANIDLTVFGINLLKKLVQITANYCSLSDDQIKYLAGINAERPLEIVMQTTFSDQNTASITDIIINNGLSVNIRNYHYEVRPSFIDKVRNNITKIDSRDIPAGFYPNVEKICIYESIASDVIMPKLRKIYYIELNDEFVDQNINLPKSFKKLCCTTIWDNMEISLYMQVREYIFRDKKDDELDVAQAELLIKLEKEYRIYYPNSRKTSIIFFDHDDDASHELLTELSDLFDLNVPYFSAKLAKYSKRKPEEKK